MSILIDALSFVMGSGTTIAYLATKRKSQRDDTNELPSMRFAWDYKAKAFHCPVCYDLGTKQQPKHCECEEFARSHFHFVCIECGYKSIMRTANDPRDRKLSWWEKLTQGVK